MYKSLLTKKFFAQNPIKELSVQRFVYSTMLCVGMEKLAEEIAIEHFGLKEEKVYEEKNMILNETNCDTLINLSRGKIDVSNQWYLIDRMLEFQDEIAPQLVSMLKRSLNDVFIGNAVKMLGKCEKNYSSELFEMMNDVRSEYAQSLICLVLGFKANEDVIPWLYSKYNYFKNNYQNENYEQGPLLALAELNARFYVKSK